MKFGLVLLIVEFWEKLPKLKRPDSTSYPSVVGGVQNPLAVTKLEFSSFFASQFQPFIVAYQTDNPMVLFFYQDLFKLILKIMQLIVKPDSLKSGRDLKKIDLPDKNIFLKCKYITIGFSARARINKLKENDTVSNAKVASFFNGLVLFIRSALERMFMKKSIGSVVVLHASVFNSTYITKGETEALQSKMKKEQKSLRIC